MLALKETFFTIRLQKISNRKDFFYLKISTFQKLKVHEDTILLIKVIQTTSKYLFKGLGEDTLPWVIFRFRIFSNYFSQKFEKMKITV